jgi:hypothetical protein
MPPARTSCCAAALCLTGRALGPGAACGGSHSTLDGTRSFSLRASLLARTACSHSAESHDRPILVYSGRSLEKVKTYFAANPKLLD